MDGGEHSTATTTALSSRSRHALLADDDWHVQLTAPPSDRYVTAANRRLPLATFKMAMACGSGGIFVSASEGVPCISDEFNWKLEVMQLVN